MRSPIPITEYPGRSQQQMRKFQSLHDTVSKLPKEPESLRSRFLAFARTHMLVGGSHAESFAAREQYAPRLQRTIQLTITPSEELALGTPVWLKDHLVAMLGEDPGPFASHRLITIEPVLRGILTLYKG